jgi:hypothetical protein
VGRKKFNIWHNINIALLQGKYILSQSYERSKVFKNFSADGNCRNECVIELEKFSLQLQAMTKEYTACGFFSLNLNLFTSVVSVIASYIVIIVQIK